MLPINLSNALQNEVTLERTNEAYYRALSAAADVVNRPGACKYFADCADDEADHARRFVNYLVDRGEKPRFNALMPIPEISGEDYIGMFRAALEREQMTTKALTAMCMVCCDVSGENCDMQTMSFLQNPDGDFPGFLAEQTKSERELTDYLLDIARLGPDGLKVFDQSLLD